MSAPDPESVAQRLRWALQALAAPAADQLRHTPAFAAQAEELALDIDNWFSVVRAGTVLTLSTEQRSALETIDRRLSLMSGRENVDLWGPEALRNAPAWAELRRLAAGALAAFGWPVEVPPANPDVYLPGEAP